MDTYNFKEVEKKQKHIAEDYKLFRARENSGKPSCYVLDMFPYPSGAGLHVGHPLGYFASDIYARYKRNKGFEVLHPMGFDAFGLPAEQYAIETGKHPAQTTEENIKRYRDQLKRLGISFDWSREIKTCDPKYYKWTQWIFLQLFQSWYDRDQNQARPLSELEEIFAQKGRKGANVAGDYDGTFTAEDWKEMPFQKKQAVLMHFRLAYQAEAEVNWCPALGTVLANDEVKEGRSERGGHPVYRKRMKQWFLRITAYAERLLENLNTLDWPNSLVEMQKNWIGKSLGAEINFQIAGTAQNKQIKTFTTRPDTIFGASYLVLAPEHEWVTDITSDAHKKQVQDYIDASARKTQRERLMDSGAFTGVFTGAKVIHPFTGEELPVWIADYVLGDYGTGAIMAVPAHDSRDFQFARKYEIPIRKVVTPIDGNSADQNDANDDLPAQPWDEKSGILKKSDFLNGLSVPEAIEKAIIKLEDLNQGMRKTSYRLRDANFSRQRFWGEPFPIVYKDGIPLPVNEDELPVVLPEVDSFKPTGSGESPLARNKNWVNYGEGMTRETDTMPASAGSSWYFLRFMDPDNDRNPFDPEKEKYWQQVDLYVGGAEHATGHLMYARFWHKFLKDRGWVTTNEPFQKLINQGMILGRSSFVYRVNGKNTFVSKNLKDRYETTALNVDINLVQNDKLDTEKFKQWRPEYRDAEFILENGEYICGYEIEKMSKSKYNVVNPDEIIEAYGTDAFRIHEMFLGPIEDSKLWNTSGIDGVVRFLKRFWRLFFTDREFRVSGEAASPEELKVLHKTIKKVSEDLERFSMNTCVSSMMECVNELTRLKCNKKEVLEPLVILLSPFAPYITQELWTLLGNKGDVVLASYPSYNEAFLVEETIQYPVSVNGKLRAQLSVNADTPKDEVERKALELPGVQKWVNGKQIRKIIVVPGKIVNIVVG